MIAADEDALICDFAETYHIYNYRELPVKYAATLASGLRADSRIMQVMSGVEISTQDALLAQIVDNTRVLVWAKTEDARHGRNYPESILKKLLEGSEKQSGYSSAEEFETARLRILGKG